MSKTVKILLALSIILNVLFVGVAIGMYSHGFKMKVSTRQDLEEVIKNFPPDKQALVTESIKSLREKTKATKKEIRAKRKEVVEVLSAPEFDPALYDTKVDELHSLMDELGNEFAATARDLALNLDQDERKALAEVIMKRRGGKHMYKESWDEKSEKEKPAVNEENE